MRYIKLLILSLILSVTWIWVQKDQKVSELVHAEIQEDLKQLIANYIKKQLPDSKNIMFKNIWSETISDGKVKAHFKYSFDDSDKTAGTAGIAVDGYAILHQKNKRQNNIDIWTLEEIQILNNHITFKEGLTLTKDSLNEIESTDADSVNDEDL